MPCLNLHFLVSYSSTSFKIYGSFLFYFFFFYFVILKFLFAVLFFLKIFLTRLVSLFAYLCRAFHFPQVFGVFMKKRVSLKRDACVLWGGSGRKPLFTFALLTLLRGLWWRPSLGLAHPAMTCQPPGRPIWVGPTVTPHAVTLEWGCHACADVS